MKICAKSNHKTKISESAWKLEERPFTVHPVFCLWKFSMFSSFSALLILAGFLAENVLR